MNIQIKFIIYYLTQHSWLPGSCSFTHSILGTLLEVALVIEPRSYSGTSYPLRVVSIFGLALAAIQPPQGPSPPCLPPTLHVCWEVLLHMSHDVSAKSKLAYP